MGVMLIGLEIAVIIKTRHQCKIAEIIFDLCKHCNISLSKIMSKIYRNYHYQSLKTAIEAINLQQNINNENIADCLSTNDANKLIFAYSLNTHTFSNPTLVQGWSPANKNRWSYVGLAKMTTAVYKTKRVLRFYHSNKTISTIVFTRQEKTVIIQYAHVERKRNQESVLRCIFLLCAAQRCAERRVSPASV